MLTDRGTEKHRQRKAAGDLDVRRWLGCAESWIQRQTATEDTSHSRLPRTQYRCSVQCTHITHIVRVVSNIMNRAKEHRLFLRSHIHAKLVKVGKIFKYKKQNLGMLNAIKCHEL